VIELDAPLALLDALGLGMLGHVRLCVEVFEDAIHRCKRIAQHDTQVR
jgi:hypothetical protein